MDCVQGELLIYRMKRCSQIEKETLFRWFRELAIQLDGFHRCRNRQCYRYVNPYSVLVTKEEKILLLDLEAESNAFVLKNMQKRAMRNHFVKPIVHIREGTKLSLDLYGFGKTIQFILASTYAVPSLTGMEERRLAKIIGKCLNENPKNPYEDMKQVEKELPVVKGEREQKRKRAKIAAFMAAAVVVSGILCFQGLGGRFGESEVLRQNREQAKEQQTEEQQMKDQQIKERQAKDQQMGGVKEAQTEKNREKTAENRENQTGAEESSTKRGPQDRIEAAKETVDAMERYLLKNTVKDNQSVIRDGEALHRELLRYLAAAYDREGRKEEALQSYQELCSMEEREELLKTAYQRRIVLEAELYQYGKEAVETGKEAMQRFPDSEELARVYLEAVSVCTELSEEERAGEAKGIAELFPALKESECYRKLKEEWDLQEEKKANEEASEKGPETENGN